MTRNKADRSIPNSAQSSQTGTTASQVHTVTNAQDGHTANAEFGLAIMGIRRDNDGHDIWLRPPAVQTTPAPQHNAPAPRTAELRRTRQRRAVTPPRNRQRRRYEATAVESPTDSSSDDSDNWRCIESDTDAEDLYRSAVAGVRNAHASRQQLRRTTNPCPVCAKFAAFLQHFV